MSAAATAIIREAHYSHTVAWASPAYWPFRSDWAATASALHDGLAKHGATPDGIKWDMQGNKPLSEYSVSCALADGLVYFHLRDVQVYLWTDKPPSMDPAAIVADVVKMCRAAAGRLLIDSHNVVLAAHLELVGTDLDSLMRALVKPPESPPLGMAQAITFGLTFPPNKRAEGTVELQRSLKFPGPSFLFARIGCNWLGDVDERVAYEWSVPIARETAGSLGLDVVWKDQ